MKSRLPLPDASRMTPEQRAIHDSIVSTRGNVEGPFLAWLHSPGLASPAEQLGAFCRYGTSLSLQESELLILCVAAHQACVGERQIHEPIALRAGLSQAAVDAIRAGEQPAFEDARLAMLHRLAVQLLRTNRIDADTFEAARSTFGDTALVEAVGIIGYYALVAHTLNAFEMTKP